MSETAWLSTTKGSREGAATTRDAGHPSEIPGLRFSGDHPRMPQGYDDEDTGKLYMRSGLNAPIPLPAETWLMHNVLKLSALDILLRGPEA